MAAFLTVRVGGGGGAPYRHGALGAGQCGLFRPLSLGVVPPPFGSFGGGFQLLRSASSSSSSTTATAPTMMAIQEVARVANAVFAILIGAGGIGAFLRTKSKPSLIAGVTSGILLAVAYKQKSMIGALVIGLVLSVVFIARLAKTRKFMPSGLLCLLSLVFSGIFLSAVLLA